jgi:pimeloyl-ACP methyl ester carboxylesterase
VLVHGFGGGTFAWRHVQQPLADQTGCRVVAFDRPAFGLTSRPPALADGTPYTVESQALLLLEFCAALGLQQVLLVAHADGALLALRASSIVAE